ncbi:MAG: methyltransferase domain-containing protein [Thiobacillus sp.]|nr:methyltransferase domain-containing protein [Thiobacillus sp.]
MITTLPTQLDANHFDARARQWDENPVFKQRGLKIADAVRKAVPLHRDMNTLDYGCGTGLLSFPLKDELGTILLADSSSGMLEVVAEKITALSITNLTVMKLDLQTDPAPTKKFDLIVTAMTLHHVPDTDHILRVFHDLLNPGGYLCIADLDKEDGSFHGPEVDVHHGFDQADLGRRTAQAGFSDIQFQTVFTINKERETEQKDYPVFLMSGRRAGDKKIPG